MSKLRNSLLRCSVAFFTQNVRLHFSPKKVVQMWAPVASDFDSIVMWICCDVRSTQMDASDAVAILGDSSFVEYPPSLAKAQKNESGLSHLAPAPQYLTFTSAARQLLLTPSTSSPNYFIISDGFFQYIILLPVKMKSSYCNHRRHVGRSGIAMPCAWLKKINVTVFCIILQWIHITSLKMQM